MVHKTPGCSRRAVWIAAILVSVAPTASAQDDLVLERALHYFTRHNAGEIFEVFDCIRPAAVSDAERGRILAMLPADGNKHDLNAAQLKKLVAVRRVLELHRREAVYVIKVIEVPQAAVALHARAVVLISERALDLPDADEVQALVAHEIGHEFSGASISGLAGTPVRRLADTGTALRRLRRHHTCARWSEPRAADLGARKDRSTQPRPVRSCAERR